MGPGESVGRGIAADLSVCGPQLWQTAAKGTIVFLFAATCSIFTARGAGCGGVVGGRCVQNNKKPSRKVSGEEACFVLATSGGIGRLSGLTADAKGHVLFGEVVGHRTAALAGYL